MFVGFRQRDGFYRTAETGGGAGGSGASSAGQSAGSGGAAGATGGGTEGQNGSTSSGGSSSADFASLQQQLAALQAERDSFKTKVEEAENAKLSEAEKLKKERDALALEKETATNALRQARAEAAIASAAGKIGADPEVISKLVSVTFDAAGNPTGVEKAVEALIAKHPYLVSRTTGGSVSNAGRAPGAGSFTREQIAAMSPDEYKKNQKAIFAAIRSGNISG